MEQSEAFNAGIAAGKLAAKDNQLLHAIEPPDDYTAEQRRDFTSGWLTGHRWQRDADFMDELKAAFS